MGFEKLKKFAQLYKPKRSHPDPSKTEINSVPELIAYNELLTSASPLKQVNLAIHSRCFEGLSEEVELNTAKQNVQNLAHGLARTEATHVVIHFLDAQDQDQEQCRVVFAEPALLFEAKKLETFTLVGLEYILKGLIQNRGLETLEVINSGSSDRLARILEDCAEAKNFKKLKVLDISNNNLSRENMTVVFKSALSPGSKIEKLYLQGNIGPELSAIPQPPLTSKFPCLSSRSPLAVVELDHVSFEFVAQLVKAASAAGSLPTLGSIVARHVTFEGPKKMTHSFGDLCAALGVKSVLKELRIIPEGSFWCLTQHDLQFDPSRMGPDVYFWNELVPWIKDLGECLNKNEESGGSLALFYLAGVTDFLDYHPGNPIYVRITEYASRILELAPKPEELAPAIVELAPTA
ncbi:hypothetical protein BGZ72_003476 [Mortierella alpina]|nr:hypothetical protein BGZ72_003476 [Mortierella alpina]